MTQKRLRADVNKSFQRNVRKYTNLSARPVVALELHYCALSNFALLRRSRTATFLDGEGYVYGPKKRKLTPIPSCRCAQCTNQSLIRHRRLADAQVLEVAAYERRAIRRALTPFSIYHAVQPYDISILSDLLANPVRGSSKKCRRPVPRFPRLKPELR